MPLDQLLEKFLQPHGRTLVVVVLCLRVLHAANDLRQGSSKTLVSKALSVQVKRSHSCDGRIELSDRTARTSAQKSLPVRQRRSNESLSNKPDEKAIGTRSDDFRAWRISRLPQRGPSESTSTSRDEQKNFKDMRDAGARMERYDQLANPTNKGTKPAKVRLRLSSTFIQPKNESRITPDLVSTFMKKRGIEDEEEISYALRSKKVKPGSKIVGTTFFPRRTSDTGELPFSKFHTSGK